MSAGGICWFGGTFNPPHTSHRRVAVAACERLRPERLLVVPCGDHPLKADDDLAPAEHRLAMCRLAFAGLDDVEVDTMEVERSGPSYTVDSVRALRARVGLEAPIFVLIGSDNLPALDRWHQPDDLFELATVIVFPRRGHPISERVLRPVGIRFAHKQQLLATALTDVEADAISASDVRARLRAGKPVPELAPEVLAYVRAHGLYGVAREAH